jgi:hypothetical protein
MNLNKGRSNNLQFHITIDDQTYNGNNCTHCTFM